MLTGRELCSRCGVRNPDCKKAVCPWKETDMKFVVEIEIPNEWVDPEDSRKTSHEDVAEAIKSRLETLRFGNGDLVYLDSSAITVTPKA